MSVATCVCALSVAAPAFAQHVDDGAAGAKIRLGPLGLTPRIAIRNVGVDSNVLRSADEPRKDFTASFEPQLDSWLRLGRARFAGKSSAEWVYFGRLTSQRSVGRTQTGMAELRMSRFAPFGGVSYARTERATSLELNTRLPQTTTVGRFGVTTTIGPALSIDVERTRTIFGLDRVTPDAGLMADSLDRGMTATTLVGRYELTPLTTLVLRTSVQKDRFDATPLRDSNSVTFAPGFEFKPFALISGTASVGYRRFNALDDQVPDFSGLTAMVNVSYVAREMTKFNVDVRRDLEYSFELTQPYYLATSFEVSVVQMLGPGWDIVGRTGGNRLNYRSVVGVFETARLDRTRTWGVGAGRHLPSGVRVGFDVDYMRRFSVVDGRGFHGYRIGGSVTYGS
jgi:hypothetical protein